jgi:hypothetical protein
LNSNMFLWEIYYYTNAAVTRVQGNTIIMPAERPDGYSAGVGNTIGQGNMGPIILTDNTFVSPPSPQAPPIQVYSQYWPDCVSVGNTFTVANTMTCLGGSPGPTVVWGPSPYLLSVNDQVVSASSVNQTPPTLPGVLPNYNRMIIDVPVGSASTGIQSAINQAASYCGQRPVVHLPHGSYSLAQTVVIPANCDIQLVGDGDQTALMWYGTGSALLLQGPSNAILRDFYVNAGTGTGILVQNADQPGSRIYMQQVSGLRSLTANIFVDSLDYTLVELQNYQLAYTNTAPASTGVGLQVVGGPLAQQGNPQGGRTNLLAGSSGANYMTYQASQGASLLVRDAWYENPTATSFAQVSGNSNVTIEGSRISNSGGVGGLAAPTSLDAVQINGLSCNATVLSSAPDSDVKINGPQNGGVWVVGNNFNNASSYFTNNAGSVGSYFNFNRYYSTSTGSNAIPDLTPVPNSSFVLQALAQSRATHPSQILDLVAGVTDVRLYRVTVELGNIGIHLTNSSVAQK